MLCSCIRVVPGLSLTSQKEHCKVPFLHDVTHMSVEPGFCTSLFVEHFFMLSVKCRIMLKVDVSMDNRNVVCLGS